MTRHFLDICDLTTAELRAIVETALAPFTAENQPARISFDGPSVVLTEHTAGGLGLAFHELATNAVKYGALSQDAGRIAIEWSVRNGRFAMDWVERGGPMVGSPGKEGFGALVVRQSIARERNGKIALEYRPDGLRCRFEFDMGD